MKLFQGYHNILTKAKTMLTESPADKHKRYSLILVIMWGINITINIVLEVIYDSQIKNEYNDFFNYFTVIMVFVCFFLSCLYYFTSTVWACMIPSIVILYILSSIQCIHLIYTDYTELITPLPFSMLGGLSHVANLFAALIMGCCLLYFTVIAIVSIVIIKRDRKLSVR